MAATKKQPTNSKETIYVDVDDEITNVIEKIKESDKKIIALVLPKRATTLQSIVNMKLLKKAAQNNKKSIVLITSETALLPLAGAAGIHVAKSLQSKPVIPPLPDHMGDAAEEPIDLGDDSAAIDKRTPVGELASKASEPEETETVEFDNLKVDDEPVTSVPKKPKKLKHLKVPNFERFRNGFVLAGLGLVLLVFGWVLAFVVMPKATIAIKTDSTRVVSSFDFTASTDQAELDVDGYRIPAVIKEVKKIDTEKAAATGERDEGTRASGEVTLSVVCGPGAAVSVPRGTAVSTGGLNYITQQTATLTTPDFGGSGCRFVDTVDIVAAENGDKYNIEDGKTFSVAGFSSVTGTNDDDISGGSSKIVKIVSQKDIDDAVARIEARQGDAASDEISSMLEAEGLLPLEESLVTGEAKITSTPEVDKEATELSVTSEIVYTMLGVERNDLLDLIKDDISEDVDLQRQSISDDGIDAAIMRINNNTTPGQAFISFRTTVTAGPEIDEDEVKEAVRGKKRGEVEDYVEGITGVQEVEVSYSPFWVYSTPKAAKKISIEIEKPEEIQSSGNSDTTND